MSRWLGMGLGVLVVLWSGPVVRLARDSFAAHMTMHIGVVAVAAPLLALGMAGGRWDPVRRAPALFPPVPLSLVELVVVWMWHAPALHHAARHAVAIRLLEQGSFLASGVLLWLAVFGGEPRDRTARSANGVVALLLTSMHMTLLGALLALSPRALYAHGTSPLGLSSLDDQQLGGAIMLLVGGVAYLLGGLVLAARSMEQRRLEGADGRRAS